MGVIRRASDESFINTLIFPAGAEEETAIAGVKYLVKCGSLLRIISRWCSRMCSPLEGRRTQTQPISACSEVITCLLKRPAVEQIKSVIQKS